jgi:Lon-like protease
VSSLPPEPPAPASAVPSRDGRRSYRQIRHRFGQGLSIALVGGFLFLINHRFDYVAILPGSADVVNERLTVSGTRTFPPKGKIMWATVGLKRGLGVFELLDGWLQSDTDVFHRKDILGDESNKQSEQRSRAEMDDAKLVARVVVARKLGYPTKDGGAEILDLERAAPAASVLRATDLIVSADGKQVCLQGDLAEVVKTKKPGDPITLGIERVTSAKGKPVVRGDEQRITVKTFKPVGADRAYIGVILGPAKEKPCSYPFKVDIDTARIGGPSAGLAMTLAMLDQLSPGELTGGVKVAATGTIESNGAVGEIGGVKQKTAAVRAAGAKLFIVPAAEYPVAKKQAGSMRVVGVKTLDQALAALAGIGGDPLPNTASR